MRRRDFITTAGAGMASWPLAARAQQTKMPMIGYLCSISADAEILESFRQGLADLGFIEGQNVGVIYRYANGQYDRLPILAADLVTQRVDLITTEPSSPAALAAKQATSTIPIVFFLGADPIGLGLISSYNRPGANVTGIDVAPETLTAKRLELLNDLVPKPSLIAELINPNNAFFEKTEVRVANEAGRTLDRQIVFLRAGTEAEIADAFEEIARRNIGGLIVPLEAIFEKSKAQIISLASRHKLPTVYPTRQFTESGGLLSYGPDLLVSHRQVGAYVAKILKGAHPADLPVMTPTTYNLVINLKTAKALGLTMPATLLARADEVID
jgi:putative tryptophan/tyrosine transport system substrate-binding protein